jgi:hypothetical protein
LADREQILLKKTGIAVSFAASGIFNQLPGLPPVTLLTCRLFFRNGRLKEHEGDHRTKSNVAEIQ